MGASADTALAIHSRGRRLAWGRVAEGPARHWSKSPLGETSALTLADGTAFGIDFTGASGADILLVTTGPAEGTGVRLPSGDVLTFHFPTADRAPAVRADGNAAVVSRQRVWVQEGRIRFGETGR